MKDKFIAFYSWVITQGIEISDKTNPYQCMDLAYSLVFFLNFPKATIQHLYAYEVYTKPSDLTRQYFDLIPNTPDGVPQAGDLVVFDKTDTYIAGHISVANGFGGDINGFTSLDQNWAGVSRVVLVNHNYNSPKVLGWLRPKPTIANYDIETSLKLLEEIKVKESFGNLEGTTRALIASYYELMVQKTSYDTLKRDTDFLIKDAVDKAVAEQTRFWQSKLRVLTETIGQLQVGLAENLTYKQLFSIAFKKLWAFKKGVS